ncbi:MAG TPA: UDP-N-acetylmuramoyl-L-alanine--D-glutamate ligase [Steroidobacteraceae bacterium]|nr:UDP-N-acetylmuramoyl-L-alanine--D-glutamate ligase [Steroidobacteraceae bacterium]
MNEARAKPSTAVIAGLGRTGYSCAAYLRARGWRVTVTDTRERPPELERLRALDPTIPVRLGGLDRALLDQAVCVVASPGLTLADPFFQEARQRGIEVVGDIELFALAVEAPVVAVTGTNGKSTVTTLVGRMAQRARLKVRVGGNLGEPALDLLTASQRDPERTELYVLELSSFQLEAERSLDLKAAAVLNVSADHLDRYASLEDYAAAKARIFARCDTAIVNLDDPLVNAMPLPGQATLSFSLRATSAADFALASGSGSRGRANGRASDGRAGEAWLTRRNEPLLPASDLKLRGLHNIANALAALALGEAIGLPLEAMLAELRSFAGLPHRSQWVAEVDGVTYVNDSKGTNVGATIAAAAGLPGPLVVILGGDGKQQDFTPLAAAFRGKVRHVVLIGRDRDAIARALAGVATLERCDSLEAAVRAAAHAARPGDTVLLSPACASLDMFRDYAHRGLVFSQAVKELAA